MMGRLGMQGEIPSAMGRAERNMNDARQSLQQGDGNRATESQSSAMDQLRQSAEQLAEQMAEQMMGQSEEGQGQGRGRGRAGREGRDPLGRDDGNGRRGAIGAGICCRAWIASFIRHRNCAMKCIGVCQTRIVRSWRGII